jgi:DNA topoisomerase II
MSHENVAERYQQKTDKEHILQNPDTYIGSVESVVADQFYFDAEENMIKEKQMEVNFALLKLFDEGIVNCRDHYIRMMHKDQKVTYIHVTIDKSTGMITLENDGEGIDVVEHPEYKIWIPELIFGHLRTSTNYNKEEKKIVGGKNGFGFKLVLIWSKLGMIETVDSFRKLKYTQTFEDNLNIIHKPKITSCTKSSYTKVSFVPDYDRLKITLTDEMITMIQKRVMDIAAMTDITCKVKFNGKVVPVKSFTNYVDLYIGKGTKRVYEQHERWEYVVALSSEFQQISFVNGISTSKGGRHVDYILQQIVKKLCQLIEKKKKISVTASTIREQIILFLRCDVENPSFDSQSKEYLTTPSGKFGSSCIVSDEFVEKLSKMGIMEKACELSEIKESKLLKKTDGSKTKTIRGIPKLLDANWAGTEKSEHCMLIFCEGDSAKAGIVSGLSSQDRNCIGVYPLKGKLLNVRGESSSKISENKEIGEIKKVLGLESGKEYLTKEDVCKNLRYAKIVCMTDQDLDGSHIKGLVINLFHAEWPSLIKIPDFLSFMNTPIMKVKKGTKQLQFYSEQEFMKWKEQNDVKGWSIKYYKGLGTSTGLEFREYFREKRIVEFVYTEEQTDQTIDMIFNKKKPHLRKEWLGNYSRENVLDTSEKQVTYESFINRELIHFSKYDCERNIPSLMDGLKTSLRKILYSAFKKKLTSEIKVAQFSGYVSEHSGYHHGEASLNGAIVGMAQTFVGSNNINLLQPNGQFGTRLRGGQDSASERYIYTQLNPLTRMLFREEDDCILEYLEDDGMTVEPIFYAPILPMILINGSKGIGTGFSTEVLSYNPLEISEYIQKVLKREQEEEQVSKLFVPYYEGFKGSFEWIAGEQTTKFLVKGVYESTLSVDKIRVTELPIGFWTSDFKELLESLIEKKTFVKDYSDMSTDVSVEFLITFNKGKKLELEAEVDKNINGIEKLLKLYTTLTTTNMHLFNAEEKLEKYDSVQDIIEAFMKTRMEMYVKRKTKMLDEYKEEKEVSENKMRYIQMVLDSTIDLRNKSKKEIVSMLKSYDFKECGNQFRYLLTMTMESVCQEHVESLNETTRKLRQKYEELAAKSIEQIWMEELKAFDVEYRRKKK